MEIKTPLRRWLLQSERYLKTDMVYLASGGFWLSLGQGVAMVAGFLISLAFANLFPKESFGTYKFILSMAGLIGVFSLGGIGVAVTQTVARGFGNALRQGFYLNLKWSAGILISGCVVSAYYLINDNTVLAYSFLLVALLSPLTASASLYGAHLLGKKDFRRNAFYGMVHNIIPAAALIITILLTDSLPLLISVYFVIGAGVPLLLYWFTLRQDRSDNRQSDPGLLSYSSHLSLMEIIGKVASHLDKILIFHYLGAAPLAIYAFAIAPVEQLQGGKKILGTLIMPKMSERPFHELQHSTPRKAFLLTFYALALAGGYAFIAPHFYGLFYPDYHEAIWYSQLYGLTLLAVVGTPFNEALIAHKKKKALYLHRSIVPLVQIALFFLLLPSLGLTGLVIAHIINRSFSSLLAFYFVKHPLDN